MEHLKFTVMLWVWAQAAKSMKGSRHGRCVSLLFQGSFFGNVWRTCGDLMERGRIGMSSGRQREMGVYVYVSVRYLLSVQRISRGRWLGRCRGFRILVSR